MLSMKISLRLVRGSYQSLEIPLTMNLISRLYLQAVDRALATTSESALWSRKKLHNERTATRYSGSTRDLMLSVSLWILVTTASVQAFIGSQACLALLHSPYVMPSLVAGFERSLHRAMGSRKTCPLSSCNAIHKKFEKEAPRVPYVLKKVIAISLPFEEHAIRLYKTSTSRTFALIHQDFKMVFQSSSWKISLSI